MRSSTANLFIGDLTQGYPELVTASYDVVICEQVLEHLHGAGDSDGDFRPAVEAGRAGVHRRADLPAAAASRPSPPGAAARPADFGSNHRRDHVQAFTLGHLKAALLAHSELRFVEARGFRIISGGVLRPLEERRWLGGRSIAGSARPCPPPASRRRSCWKNEPRAKTRGMTVASAALEPRPADRPARRLVQSAA